MRLELQPGIHRVEKVTRKKLTGSCVGLAVGRLLGLAVGRLLGLAVGRLLGLTVGGLVYSRVLLSRE